MMSVRVALGNSRVQCEHNSVSENECFTRRNKFRFCARLLSQKGYSSDK